MSTKEIEKDHLEIHVELCAQRYDNLAERLSKIETKVSELSDTIKSSQNSMTKIMIGTAGTVVTGVISTIIVLLTKLS
jgi:Mg2+ and Co2+ transporter CorA